MQIGKEHGYKRQERRALLGLGEAFRDNNQFQTVTGRFKEGLEGAKRLKYTQTEKQASEIAERSGDRNDETTAENTMKDLSKIIGKV